MTDHSNYHAWVRAQARRVEREISDRELIEWILEVQVPMRARRTVPDSATAPAVPDHASTARLPNLRHNQGGDRHCNVARPVQRAPRHRELDQAVQRAAPALLARLPNPGRGPTCLAAVHSNGRLRQSGVDNRVDFTARRSPRNATRWNAAYSRCSRVECRNLTQNQRTRRPQGSPGPSAGETLLPTVTASRCSSRWRSVRSGTIPRPRLGPSSGREPCRPGSSRAGGPHT